MSTCEEIAAYAERATWDAVSPEARDKLKQHLLDAVGCALGALGSGPMSAIAAEERATRCAGGCSLIGGGISTPERAAFHNGALTRYLDFMDTFIAREEACHPSDNLAPLLVAAELSGASGSDFLTSMAVAYHIQCRMTASDAPVMRSGFDHTLPLSVSIAAGVARLLGLDRQKAAHAIALCASDGLSLGAARSGKQVPQWKGLAAASASFQCVHNVRLAQQGITGPLHAFEGPLGLRQVLGKPFGIDWTREGYDGVLACSLKKFNAEFHAQSLLEGLLELRESHGLRAEDVKSIRVKIFKAGYEMIGGGKYVDPMTVETKEDADHSLPYLVAVALLDGEVWPEQFEESRIGAGDVQALMRKVESEESSTFTRAYPNSMCVRMTVHRTSDKPIRIEKSRYSGFFRQPMKWDDVIAKFLRLGSHAASEDQLLPMVRCVRDLEQRSASELISMLRDINGTVGRPVPAGSLQGIS